MRLAEKAPIKFKGQPNWSFLPVQDHSHKPEELYSIIERCSYGNYLELFARRPVPSDKNWYVWGNEIESDIILPNYPVPKYSQRALNHYFTKNKKMKKIIKLILLFFLLAFLVNRAVLWLVEIMDILIGGRISWFNWLPSLPIP